MWTLLWPTLGNYWLQAAPPRSYFTSLSLSFPVCKIWTLAQTSQTLNPTTPDFCSVNIEHLLSESRNGLKKPVVHGYNESTVTISFKCSVENDNTQCSKLESPLGEGPLWKIPGQEITCLCKPPLSHHRSLSSLFSPFFWAAFKQIWAYFQHPTPLNILSSNISFWKKSMFNWITSPVCVKEKTEYSHFHYKKPYVSLFFFILSCLSYSQISSHKYHYTHARILWNIGLNFFIPLPFPLW